jgi:hypothetical protein
LGFFHTSEILSELQVRINDMEDRDLVRFLACLLPQKLETTTQGNIKYVIELVDPDNPKNPNQIQAP